MNKTLLKASLFSFGLMFFFNALAEDIPAAIKSRLDATVPGYDTSSVKATPLTGLYQFIADGRVLYISADGRYIISGNVIDLESKQNLTEQTQRQVTKKIIDAYDEKKMIIFAPKGKTNHTITVFTDVDCPLCSMLL